MIRLINTQPLGSCLYIDALPRTFDFTLPLCSVDDVPNLLLFETCPRLDFSRRNAALPSLDHLQNGIASSHLLCFFDNSPFCNSRTGFCLGPLSGLNFLKLG